MTVLTIEGETFRVLVEGDAGRPKVMLSNSLGTDLTLWDAQMPALLERFQVVRYDPRGHGRSVAAERPCSISRLGRDALAILDALQIEKTHFVGISMGGAVAQWLLVNAPERLERAVLANTAARLGSPDLWNMRIQTVLSSGMEPLVEPTMERWFGADFRSASPSRISAVEAVFRATSPMGYAACCAALRDMDLRESLGTIAHPVLVVSGREDPVTSDEDIALLVERIRGAKHVALDCRHISNIEAEARFNAVVIEFLTAKAAAGAPRARATRMPAGARTRHPTTGRATAARHPLAKSSVGPVGAKSRTSKVEASKKADAGTAPRRRPAPKAKTARTRTATPKRATPEKPALSRKPKTVSAKATLARRKTLTTAARGVVKKPATKTKAAKAPQKKSAPKKAPSKKVPIARRKATTKPRRPTGRRKP